MKIETFSANFDQELFTRLMGRVGAKWPDVLPPARIQELVAFCLSLEHNEEKPLSFSVQHQGVTSSFGIRAFMDDIEFPDIEFFSFPEFIQTIREEHARVCEELGY